MKAVLFAAAALLLAACSESTGPAAGLRVEISKSVYGLVPATPVPPVLVEYSVRNTGSETVALPQCGHGVIGELQQRKEGEWVTIATGFCPTLAIYSPIMVAPGETAQGGTFVTEPGRYRIRIPVEREPGEGISGYATSAEFEARWLED